MFKVPKIAKTLSAIYQLTEIYSPGLPGTGTDAKS